MRIRGVVAAVWLVTLGAPLWAQHADHVSSGLRVVVDGKISPEKIPDHLAYAHLLLLAVSGESASPLETARLAALLEPAQLTKEDSEVLAAVLTDLRRQIAFIAAAVERLSLQPRTIDIDSKLVTFKLQRTRVLDEAIARLNGRLSPAGSAQLNAYVRTQFKKTIAIYAEGTP